MDALTRRMVPVFLDTHAVSCVVLDLEVVAHAAAPPTPATSNKASNSEERRMTGLRERE